MNISDARKANRATPIHVWRDAVKCAAIPPLTKLVLLTIATHLSCVGEGWRITCKQLEQETGLAARSLTTHIAKAVAVRLLELKRHHGASGHRISTIYTAVLPGQEGASNEEGDPSLSAGDASRPGGLSASGARLSASGAPRLSASGAGQVSSPVSTSQGPSQTLSPQAQPSTPPASAGGETETAFGLWNDLAWKIGQQPAKPTPGRTRQLERLLRNEGGLDAWRNALAEAERSGFLRGGGPNGWVITLGWLLNPDNFLKVLEGNFRDKDRFGSFGRRGREAALAMDELRVASDTSSASAAPSATENPAEAARAIAPPMATARLTKVATVVIDRAGQPAEFVRHLAALRASGDPSAESADKRGWLRTTLRVPA
ncbi:MAG: hypothetical protein AB7O44_29155 [Hyphomicrobiaceae bacterium]